MKWGTTSANSSPPVCLGGRADGKASLAGFRGAEQAENSEGSVTVIIGHDLDYAGELTKASAS